MCLQVKLRTRTPNYWYSGSVEKNREGMVGSGKRDRKSRAVAEDPVSDGTPHIEQLIGDPTPMVSLDTGVIYTCVCMCVHTHK